MIAQRERPFVWIVALVLVVLILLPVFTQIVAARPLHTTGYGFFLNGDKPAYTELIWQARRGHLLFNNQLTSEPNPQVLLRPTFLLLGWFSGVTRIPPQWVFNIGLVGATVATVWVTYLLAARIFAEVHQRRLALVLLTTAGGLAWLNDLFPVLLTGSFATLPRPDIFTALQWSPHIALAIAGIMLIALLLWFARGILWSGLSLLLLGLIVSLDHPYDVPTLLWIAGAALLVSALADRTKIRARFVRAVLLATGVSLGAGLTWWGLRSSSVLQAWNQANAIDLGDFWTWLAAFGLVVPLALLGWWVRRHSSLAWFLGLWAVGQAILMALPIFPAHQKIMEGLVVPLGLLATFALLNVRWARWPVARYLITLVLALSTLSLTALATGNSRSYMATDAVQSFFEIARFTYPDSYAEGFDWLAQHTTDQDVITGSVPINVAIVGLVGRRVVVAHWGQTVDYYATVARLAGVFEGVVPVSELVTEYEVTYLWIGREERAYMAAAGVSTEQLLPGQTPVFANTEVAIYQLDQAGSIQ